MAVAVPANVMTIEEILVPIVMFDVFESDETLEIVDHVFGSNLVGRDLNSEIPEQIQDLGIEDSN